MRNYILEACERCGVVRLVLIEDADAARHPDYHLVAFVSDLPLWRVDFCPSCLSACEQSLDPPEGLRIELIHPAESTEPTEDPSND